MACAALEGGLCGCWVTNKIAEDGWLGHPRLIGCVAPEAETVLAPGVATILHAIAKPLSHQGST